MPPPRSVHPSRRAALRALLALLAPTVGADAARASPCCAGSTTPGFEHLALWEKVAGGVRSGVESGLGQWDARGRWRPHTGYEERVARFELWVVGRPLEPLQVGARLPWIYTARRAGDRTDSGGGVGDLGLSARWDVFAGGEGPLGLGFAGVVGLSAPTGRDTAEATGPLGADATGEGSFTPSIGLVLMRPWDATFVRLQGSVGRPWTRTVGGVEHRAGLGLDAALVGGVSPVPALTLSLSVDMRLQQDATISGVTVSDSGRSALHGALGAAWDLPGRFEILALQATLRAPLPVDGVGRNSLAGLGGTVGVRAGWP